MLSRGFGGYATIAVVKYSASNFEQSEGSRSVSNPQHGEEDSRNLVGGRGEKALEIEKGCAPEVGSGGDRESLGQLQQLKQLSAIKNSG